MQISLLALHRLMMLATSVASFLVQRVPSDRTTRRALIAVAVCEVYQVCAWLTPRATNGVPSFSTSWVPDTCRPGGAAAWAAVDNSDVAPSATTAAARAAPDSKDLRDLMGLPRSVGIWVATAQRAVDAWMHPPAVPPAGRRAGASSHNQVRQALSTARNASHRRCPQDVPPMCADANTSPYGMAARAKFHVW